MSARFLASAAALCCLALSGCGGGGGGGSASMTPMTEPEPAPMTEPEPAPMTEPEPAPGVDNVQQRIAQFAASGGKAGEAATNAPRAGSVTQSSNGVNGATADRVEVSLSFGADNAPTISVSNTPDSGTGRAWTMNSADAADDDIVLSGSRAAFVIPDEDGVRWVGLRTDRESQADTDYLVYGLWAWIPRDENQVEDFEIGVFADGGEPFTGANVLALTGTATYRGEANGIYSYSDPDDGGIENDFFEADVELNANFGAADAAGTISGEITNPTSDGSRIDGPGGNPIVLTLGAAPIGTNDGGFFTGEASMSLNDISHTGRWGGEFFGNGAAGTAPGSVAGTFGVTGTDPTLGRATLVGAFAAAR